MRKTFFRIAVVVLLLLILFTSFLKIRQYNSYEKRIHNKANFVAKINVDGIIQTIITDCITHPGFYISYEKSTSKDTSLKGSGISIPANVFIYTIEGKSATTLFTSLPVADTIKLKKYISKKLGIDSFYSSNAISAGISADGKMSVAFNNNKIALAYSPMKDVVVDILRDMVTETNMRPTSDTTIHELKRENNHIVLWSRHNTGVINFKDGKIEMKTALHTGPFFNIPDTAVHRSVSKQGLLYGWLNATPKAGQGNKSFTIKEHSFDSDSLFKCYNGYVDFELGSKMIAQEDSVITYGYNDDFEKVAEVTIAKNKVPDINIYIKANGNSLYDYLKTNDAIKGNDVINRELFPLYAFSIAKSGNYMQFNTGSVHPQIEATEQGEFFFYLFADAEKIKNNAEYASLKKYIEKITSLELKAKKKSDAIAELTGNIFFERKNINALAQMTQ